MKRVVDRILQILGGNSVDWIKWSRNVITPAELDGQIDDWACGLFVLMALCCFALRIDYKRWCRDSAKEDMRRTCLDHLMNLPYAPPFWKKQQVNKIMFTELFGWYAPLRSPMTVTQMMGGL